jgi:pimeloyl-ACP methyl ester carboxylesterase
MPASPVRLPRQAAALLAFAALSLALPATAAAKLTWRACADQLGFQCATLRVPLDRTGQTPGTIGLKVAREDRKVTGGKILISLSGGPGQGAVAVAPFVEQAMAPALVHHKLVVLDQRGTGDSGVLRCPHLQRSRLLNPFTANLAAQCAGEIGPTRDFYTTADTVADLDDLRQALGVDKLALQGTSYGTFVAQQYARIHPDHVERLVLDSVVGPDGVDAFLTDTWSATPRILTEMCGGTLCRGITTDPVGEMRALAAKIEGAPMKGFVVDGDGRRKPMSIGGVGLVSLLVAGDLNSHLRAALPGAVHSALNGDPAALLRLIPPGVGSPLGLKDLSYGLNAATTCTETNLPYPLATPIPDRPQKIADALAALPDALLGPFSRSLVERSSTAEQCKLWPVGRAVLPTTSPLPDVPALILSGRLDTRTPTENAEAVARELPHSTLVTVPGNGHDEIDSDLSGCVARALFRFFSNRRIGDACERTTDAVPPAPVAPTALSQLPPHRGNPGDRGRVLRAAVDTIDDMREQFFINSDGGLNSTRGGGLRGGAWRTRGETGFVLDRLEWCPGVRVSGRLTSRLGRYAGVVRVSAPEGLSGTLRFDRRKGLTGTLGGKRVHLPARAVRGAVEPALERVLG